MMMEAFVSRTLAVLHGPVAAPVIEKGYRTLHPAACHLADGFQGIAYLRHFPEHPGVTSAIMVDHGPVELLGSAAALADLEIKGSLTAVGYGLHGLGKENARLFQLADALPVRGGGAGLHLEEGFLLKGTHEVMAHGVVPGDGDILLLSPGRISVPGNHVDVFRHLEIIETVKVVHQVGCHRKTASCIANSFDLPAHEIAGLMGDKAFPVKIQGVKLSLADLRGALDIIKALVGMAPESRTPAAVEIPDRLIFLFQPVAESCLA